MHPAILLQEFDSIAVGIAAGDAMAKRAQLKTLHTGTVVETHADTGIGFGKTPNDIG